MYYNISTLINKSIYQYLNELGEKDKRFSINLIFQ